MLLGSSYGRAQGQTTEVVLRLVIDPTPSYLAILIRCHLETGRKAKNIS